MEDFKITTTLRAEWKNFQFIKTYTLYNDDFKIFLYHWVIDSYSYVTINHSFLQSFHYYISVSSLKDLNNFKDFLERKNLNKENKNETNQSK